MRSSIGAAVVPPLVVAPHRKREWLGWVAAGVLSVASAVMYFRAAPPPIGPLEVPVAPPENSFFQVGSSAPGFESLLTASRWQLPRARGIPTRCGSDRSPRLRGGNYPEQRERAVPSGHPTASLSGSSQDGKLKTVTVSGGSPVVVTDTPENVKPNIFSGASNHNGIIVFAEGANPLRSVRVGGGDPTPVTRFSKGDTAHRWPSFLPDGEHFLFLATRAGASELRLGSLSSFETTSLGPLDSNARYASGYLLLVRAGRLMAQRFDPDARQLTGNPLVLAENVITAGPWQPGQFSVSATGVLGYSRLWRRTSHLTWMDRSGTVLESIGEPGLYLNLDLSHDDRRLAVSADQRTAWGRIEY